PPLSTLSLHDALPISLFVNHAQHFGLAELHQIRGRIGRSTQQAYAYFLTRPDRELSDEARARLEAIQEYAELGAGFKLAMRDLEIGRAHAELQSLAYL